MHPSVYAVLLTCLCGSSFGAPIGAPFDQATGLLDEVTKGLPVNGAAENLVGSIVKRTVVPTTLGNSVPVGQDADGLTRNGFENIVGDLAKAANVGSVVPSSTDKGLLDGLPVKSANELPKGLPLAGGEEKRDTGLPVGSGSSLLENIPLVGGKKPGAGLPVGSESELFKGLPLGAGEEKKGAGLPFIGSGNDLFKGLPLGGGKGAGLPVGSGNDLFKGLPLGGKKKRDTGLPVDSESELLKNIPLVGGGEKPGAGLPVDSESELLKNIPLVGGEEKSDTGLPVGNVDQMLEPVTGIVDGPLKGFPAGL